MHSDDFYHLVDQLASSSKVTKSTGLLSDFLAKTGLAHMSYLGLNLPGPTARPLLAMTYTSAWQKQYAQERYIDVDPVIRAGLGGILPVDWADIDRSGAVAKKFFGEAQELEVGKQGLSIPIRGRNGEFALFSLTADCGPSDWNARRRDLIRDAMIIGYNFHASVLREVAAKPILVPEITHREASCLRWKAHGKSDKEIGLILGISPHTVRFHVECARTKLDAGNATQAVAKAISLGLITLAYDEAVRPS